MEADELDAEKTQRHGASKTGTDSRRGILEREAVAGLLGVGIQMVSERSYHQAEEGSF